MQRKLGCAILMLLLFAGSIASGSAQESVTANLRPIGGSGVSGTAVVSPKGNGTEVTFDLSGLASNAGVRAAMQAGTCEMPGASFAEAGTFTADSEGRATGTGEILFRGAESVEFIVVADGEHIITVSGPEGAVACGAIPAAQQGAPAIREEQEEAEDSFPWVTFALLIIAMLLLGWAAVQAGERAASRDA